MRKAIIAVVAAVVAMGVTPLIVVAPASAEPPPCRDPYGLGVCRPGGICEQAGNCWGEPQHPPSRPAQTPQVRPPAQTPQVSPPAPPPANTAPAQTPQVNQPSSPPVGKPARRLPPPKGLEAPPQAVAAAKAAPASRIDPANPPKPPAQQDFAERTQNVIRSHSGNVDVVQADGKTLARPRHWEYVDYDEYHRPNLYNPLGEGMTFRYFYGGAYHEAHVPAGGRIVLDVSVTGVFPFTAVSDSYLASGSFTGGAWVPPEGWSGPPPATYTPPAPPTVYHDVSARIPAANQTIEVGQVLVVGHDGSQPVGSQDTFLLDDSTLAWGQLDDPRNGGQVTVARTQSLPGVGPIDNGTLLTELAAPEEAKSTWWPWAVGGGLLLMAAGLVAWMVARRKRSTEPAVSE